MAGQKPHTYTLSAYPKTVGLRDGTSITLRPMQPDDAGALLAFFQKLSREDRFFLKEDVASPVVIQRWVDDMDYDRALPIIALDGDTIVADGTLHRSRANARRHIGQIRIAVAEDYRNRGLGTTLLNELATIANEHGLERLLLEAVSDHEDDAIKAAEYVGFVRVGSLPGHAKDLQDRPRDIVLLEMPLGKWFDWWRF